MLFLLVATQARLLCHAVYGEKHALRQHATIFIKCLFMLCMYHLFA